jgi:integrase
MARRDGAGVRLITRHGNDFIHRFPLAVAAVRALPSARFWRSHRHQLRRSAEAALPPKVVQARLGHASIVMTLDTYGHLFPRGDDGAELATAEKALLGGLSTVAHARAGVCGSPAGV